MYSLSSPVELCPPACDTPERSTTSPGEITVRQRGHLGGARERSEHWSMHLARHSLQKMWAHLVMTARSMGSRHTQHSSSPDESFSSSTCSSRFTCPRGQRTEEEILADLLHVRGGEVGRVELARRKQLLVTAELP
eukprot:761746-Hanusia_phi.AAC.2